MKGIELKTVKKQDPELPWDMLDRCFLPIVFSHAVAVILSTILNTLYISQVSTFFLFILFLIISLGSTIFYHNLKVTYAGKCILITGCDSKIGYATAKYLDELGLIVFACFGKQSDSSAKLKGECSGRLKVLELDVTSEQSIKAAVEYVENHLPENAAGLWAIINGASWAAFGEVEWVPISVFKHSTDVNLLGTVRVTQAFLPQIRKTKGRIINIVSILGRIASPMRSPFCSVKFGIEAFSECLRLEMRKWGVDVIVVEPGQASTGTWFDNKAMLDQAREMWEKMNDKEREDCGENCFEYKIRTMPEYNTTEGDVSAVLRSLGDAVIRTFPLARYTPVTRDEKIQTLIAHHLPRSVYDIIYS